VLSSHVIDDNIGYIRIRGWHSFGEGEFDRLLEPFRDKPCLVIDVRDNGGGSDELAETVIGRFIQEKVLCSVSFQRQSGTEMYEKLIHIADPRGPWCYQGKVAVLTNEGCASACEHFVSGMFEAGALLVGRPTTGACGWSQGIELPCGVTLGCSLTFPLHGKMPSPLHGIEPHYLVEPTIDDIRSDRDPILEKAKALLSP
jgi:C-terminal processing protease CtpA/Prc